MFLRLMPQRFAHINKHISQNTTIFAATAVAKEEYVVTRRAYIQSDSTTMLIPIFFLQEYILGTQIMSLGILKLT